MSCQRGVIYSTNTSKLNLNLPYTTTTGDETKLKVPVVISNYVDRQTDGQNDRYTDRQIDR